MLLDERKGKLSIIKGLLSSPDGWKTTVAKERVARPPRWGDGRAGGHDSHSSSHREGQREPATHQLDDLFKLAVHERDRSELRHGLLRRETGIFRRILLEDFEMVDMLLNVLLKSSRYGFLRRKTIDHGSALLEGFGDQFPTLRICEGNERRQFSRIL